MTEFILDIITKYPQEKHITQNTQSNTIGFSLQLKEQGSTQEDLCPQNG